VISTEKYLTKETKGAELNNTLGFYKLLVAVLTVFFIGRLINQWKSVFLKLPLILYNTNSYRLVEKNPPVFSRPVHLFKIHFNIIPIS
jgi:hypothetical protein